MSNSPSFVPTLLRVSLAVAAAAVMAGTAVMASPADLMRVRPRLTATAVLADPFGPARPSLEASASGSISTNSPCGGEGERACIIFEQVPSCDAGLIEIPGCTGDCNGGTPEIPILSLGMCVKQTACGGRGQRACTVLEAVPSCQGGLVEIPGCTGDCWGPGGLKSLGMCTAQGVETMSEPTTNAIPTVQACSLSGYSDMHMHMFADMAHGGGVLAGKPYDPAGGVNVALRPDFTTDVDLVNGDGTHLGTWSEQVSQAQTDGSVAANLVRDVQAFAGNLLGFLLPCPAQLYGGRCNDNYLHAFHDPLFGDSVGSFVGTKDGAGFSNFGAPLFNGWPRWTSTTHQQVYYKWLERAWQGGLRHMTQLAVTNEALCRGSKHLAGVDCSDSMASIDQQIDAAYDFQEFLDTQSGGAGKGWFRIVKTPLEARDAIATGKLAVTLGIETAELFNCYETGDCNAQFIESEVDRYYEKGVRHVFPIHNFDNAFGAAATWQDGIEVGQRVVEGRWWQTRDCDSQQYGFKLGSFTQAFISILRFTSVIPSSESAPGRSERASCNANGMRPLGEVLMSKLMQKGMIIDVDHMSTLAFDRALQMAEQFPGGYGGIAASHVLSFDRHQKSIVVDGETTGTRHERLRTSAQLQRIKNVGGMVAAMLKDDGQDTGLKGKKYTIGYGNVADDCRHSSKTFAHAYQYAVDQMGGPVALGSDFNGIAGHIGPRFGMDACGENLDERNAQLRANNKVGYPFTIDGFGTFDRQVTGQRTFDYNVDGMAHVGMLPDFIQDLRKVGLQTQYINSLFGSAEAYIKMWERATAASPSPLDDTPQSAINNTCDFIVNPDIRFTSVPSQTNEGSATPIKFTARKNWQVTASCGPTPKVHAQSLVKSSSVDAGNDEYTLTCTWRGGKWDGGSQIGTASVSATRLGASGSGSATVPVVNRPIRFVSATGLNVTVPVGFHTVKLQYADDDLGEAFTFTSTWDGVAQGTVSAGAVVPLQSSKAFTHATPPGQPHQFTYTISDEATSVSGSGTVTVTGADTTPPVLDLSGPIVAEATGPTTSLTFKAMATDAVWEYAPVTCTSALVPEQFPLPSPFVSVCLDGPCSVFGFQAPFPIAAGTVACTATDYSDNSTSGSFSVTVRDTTPPALTVPASPLTVQGTAGLGGANVTYAVNAVDLVDGVIVPSCTRNSGAFFPLGTTTVECSATDSRNNKSTKSFSVVVDEADDDVPPALVVSEFASPRHHWRFEEDGGHMALDSTSWLVHGTLGVNVTRSTQQFCGVPAAGMPPVGRGVLNFSATLAQPSVITMPASTAAQFDTGDFTIAFWFKTNDQGVLLTSRAGKGDTGSGATIHVDGQGLWFSLKKTNNQELHAVYYNEASRPPHPFDPSEPARIDPQDGNWHFVTVVKQGNLATLHLDRQQGESVAMGTGGNGAGGNALRVGAIATFFPLSTSIDELEIFNRAITSPELFYLSRQRVDADDDGVCDQPIADISEAATSGAGAPVSFTAFAVDPVSGQRPVTCVDGNGTPRQPGSVFPIGLTHLTCTTMDKHLNSHTLPVTVEVKAGFLPLLTMPEFIHTPATQRVLNIPHARVNYSVEGFDGQDGVLHPTCTPASGSLFRIGATEVSCSVSDNSGNSTTGTFTISVFEEPPVMTLTPPAVNPLEATGPAGATASFSVTAVDAVDGIRNPTCNFPIPAMFPIGSIGVTCSASDLSGLEVSAQFTMTVVDTTGPAITPPANVTAEATGPGGAAVSYSGGTAIDLVSGNRPLSCVPASGSTFAIGQHPITCTASDARGNSGSGTFTVRVVDTTPPAVTVPANMLVIPTGPSGANVTFAATATDLVNGSRPTLCLPASGSLFAIGGPYTVTCKASDVAGNIGSATFTVTVGDTIPPVVSVPGPIVVEAAGPHGTDVPFNATATDNVDGTLTATCTPAAGRFAIGTRTVTCTAQDAAHNIGTATFEVTVRDTTPPVVNATVSPDPNDAGWHNVPVQITWITTDTVGVTTGDGCDATTITQEGAGVIATCIATDAAGNSTRKSVGLKIDRTPPAITGTREPAANAAGWNNTDVVVTFDCSDGNSGIASCPSPAAFISEGAGQTGVGVARDVAGNDATFTVSGVNIDKAAPVLTVTDVVAEATGPAGSQVAFTATALDALQGAITPTCSRTSGSLFTLGATQVTCSVTDRAGNTASASFRVTVVDTTPPAITGQNVTMPSPGPKGVPVSLPVSASDLVSGSRPVSCTPAGGSVFPLGTTPVSCTSTDAAGNTSTASFTVTVTQPASACFIVDFREITYFNGNKVITSSDGDIRARNGIGGAFNPELWPYRSSGGSQYSKSRGTLFRIYGFRADQLGQIVRDADDPSITYAVQRDASIADGAYYVDLGGPRRVSICPEQLHTYVLAGEKGNGHLDSSQLLPEAQRNVPGIMLTANQQILKLPYRIRRELTELSQPSADRGLINYIGFQVQGGGNAKFSEFVDVEISFPWDSETDLARHYTHGFHTATNTNFESFAGCNYLDSAPGNDSVRLTDLWSPNRSSEKNQESWEACGRREPKGNQRVRANYEVPFNAIQLLPTVTTGTDTTRLFYGAVKAVPKDTKNDHRKDWREWDDEDERHERDKDRYRRRTWH